MTDLSLSVVIPTYNRAKLVVRAVASAIACCRDADEIIVVDDGSMDDTAQALARYAGRIEYIRVANGGPGRARNIGIRAARHPLVAFLDSDDEWIPGTLDWKRALMEARPDILFCFSNFGVRELDGTEIHNYLLRWEWGQDRREWSEFVDAGVALSSLVPGGASDAAGVMVHVGDLYGIQMSATYLLADTLVVRREAAGAALQFPEDLPTYEDWECFSRLAHAGAAAYLDCDTAWQYGHAGPRVTDTAPLPSLSARITLMERLWGSDPDFLRDHGTRYRAVLDRVRIQKARALLSMGQSAAARRELRFVHRPAPAYRALSRVPGVVTLGLVRGRAMLLALLARLREA